ncbi:zonadhesin-like [Pomacea canaliculata]|uniref:zonadhesin-like n=1 Tax=Pomacea canaliculata TaxID=400727 RepID=UPI000D729E36|nr:zonadhesin-like [Pomacea canaliculata]
MFLDESRQKKTREKIQLDVMKPTLLACVLLLTCRAGAGAELCGTETCGEGEKCYEVCQTPLCTGGIDQKCIVESRLLNNQAAQQKCPNGQLPVLYPDRLWFVGVHECSNDSHCPAGRQCVNSACCPPSVPVPVVRAASLGALNPLCPPLCRMGCRYGFQVDAKGCPMCACRPEPCENYQCPSGTKCKVMGDVDKCDGIVCSNLYPACIDAKTECPLVACRMLCPFGKELDDNGCELCGCKDVCRQVVCPTGKKCQPNYPSSQNSPSAPQFSCVDINPNTSQCSPITCRKHCPYGAKTDERGCEMCQCNDEPVNICSTMVCPDNQKCQMVTDSTCTTGFCPRCVAQSINPLALCARVLCRLFCPEGFEKDEQGCDTCQCKKKTTPAQTCTEVRCSAGQICALVEDCPTCGLRPVCFDLPGTTLSPNTATTTTTVPSTTPPLTPRVLPDTSTDSSICSLLRFFLTNSSDSSSADKRLAAICKL